MPYTYSAKKMLVLLSLTGLVLFFCYRHQSERFIASEKKSSFNYASLYPFHSHSIFFIETSGNDRLNPRQACAVESAALSNQDTPVHVLFTSGWDRSQELFSIIERHVNVDITRINFHEYLAGTPLERWTKRRELEKSQYRVAHTSDILRLVTLWKYGGLYLDLDVVVARNLSDLGCNWVGFESPETPGSSVLCFDTTELGRRFTDDALMEIRNNYRSEPWGHNGPHLVARVMKRMCTDGRFPGQREEERCKGLRIFPSEYFYPIPYEKWKDYFQEEEWDKIRQFENKTYLYHMWNNLSTKTKINESMPYARLSKKFCPNVYETTRYYF